MSDRIGQQIGNYRLVRLLGEGGFAEVYLGENIHIHTQVAIKLLHAQLASHDVDFFRKEAYTIAHLVHPHIIRVFDFGVENRIPYLVMDYAPNGTLRQRHPRGIPLPLPTIVTYVKQVADGLQYAHDEKLIHRDIKPENMLIGRRNEILLSDFGIAIVAQSTRFQSTQEVIGTVAYMAPEQIQAHPRPASDQYSLGVIVYEWLTGSVPFQGSFTEVALKHTIVPPPPLRERVPNISPAVEEVVMTALEKDPHKRFGSVQAFANAFEQACQSPRPQPASQTFHPSQSQSSSSSSPSLPPTVLQPPSQEPVQAKQPITEGKPLVTPPVLNTPSHSLSPTVFQPPASDAPTAMASYNVKSSPSQPAPVTTPEAAQAAQKPAKSSSRRTLIDYLIPTSTRKSTRIRDSLLVIGFSILLVTYLSLRVEISQSLRSCSAKPTLSKRYATILFLLWTNLYIEYPGVYSGQFFLSLDVIVVLLTSAVLGKWRGLLVMLVYLVATVVGFSGVRYGLDHGVSVIGVISVTPAQPYTPFLSYTWNYILRLIYPIVYPVIAFIVGWLCERRLDRRFRTALLVMLPVGLILSFAGFHGLECGYYSCRYTYGSIFNGYIFNNYFFGPAVIGYLVQALLVAVALPLLWKLPRVKRNMSE